MDPTPAPTPVSLGVSDELTDFAQSIEDIAILVVVGLVVTLVLVTILVWSIYRSAKFRPEAMLVIVLGVLALVSSLGYLVGGESRQELITLAAAAVGALAGALTIMANAFVKNWDDEVVARKVDTKSQTQEDEAKPPTVVPMKTPPEDKEVEK